MAGTQAALHGVTQGVISGITGGSFETSFVSAMASSIVSSGVQLGGAAAGIGDSDTATILFGTASGALSAKLTNGNVWQGAAVGFFVSALNHAAHKITDEYALNDYDKEQKGRQHNMKSLGIKPEDSGETIINKIMDGMKPGDYVDGDMFSFINSEIGNYIKTVTRIDANNFKINTKGLFTEAVLKNNSTLAISQTDISSLKINGTYKITINGLTSLGKGQIHQTVWVNENLRYMYYSNKKEWVQSKIK